METVIQPTSSTTTLPPLEQPLPKPTALRAFWTRFGTTIVTIINLSLFFVLWQSLQGGAEPWIDTRWIPPPLDVLEALVTNTLNGKLIDHLLFSGTNYVLGFAITIILGVPMGVFLGLNKTIRNITQTYVWIGYSTPSVAILPILTVLLGFGIEAKVFLVMLATFFPIAINVLNGVATVDPVLLKAGRLFGANPWQLFRKITLPAVLPWIMTGIRIGSRRGLRAIIIAELFGSTKGLAYMVRLEADRFQSAKSYAAIVMLMLLSLIVLNGVAWVEQRATPWRVTPKL